MSNESNVFTDQQQSILRILDKNVSAILDVNAALEGKARYNFSLISAVATVVVTVNLSLFNSSSLNGRMIAVLVMFALLYILVAFLAISVLQPKLMHLSPIDSKWDHIRYWWELDWEEFPRELLANYSTIDKHNTEVVKEKARVTKSAYSLTVLAILTSLLEVACYVPANAL